MKHRLRKPVRASWLAKRLGVVLVGPDLDVALVTPLDDLTAGALSFCKAPLDLAPGGPALVIGPPGMPTGAVSVLASERPRLDFVRALELLEKTSGFDRPTEPPQIHPTARIEADAILGNGVMIGEDSVIGHRAVIGEGVRIGRRCRIKSGAIIGEDGFGFERDENGLPLRMVHLGSVVIGDDVEVGSLSTICRGTLGDTIVENHVKIDDHVHVAHNCRLREGAIITACAELSGGVEVGRFAWVSPNSAVMQKARIGERATVGLGAAVVGDVKPETTVFGNPAKRLVKPSGEGD